MYDSDCLNYAENLICGYNYEVCSFNKQSCRIWSMENPHVMVENKSNKSMFETDFGLVHIGLKSNRAMLTDWFFDETKAEDMDYIWFQLYGATCYIHAKNVRKLNNQQKW